MHDIIKDLDLDMLPIIQLIVIGSVGLLGATNILGFAVKKLFQLIKG